MSLELFCPKCGSALHDTYGSFNAELKKLKKGDTISFEWFQELYIDSFLKEQKRYTVVDKSKNSLDTFMHFYCRFYPGGYSPSEAMFYVDRTEKTGRKHYYEIKNRYEPGKVATSEIERIYITMDDRFCKFPHNRIDLIDKSDSHNCPVCGGEIKQIRCIFDDNEAVIKKIFFTYVGDRTGSSYFKGIYNPDQLNSLYEDAVDKEECRKETAQYIDECSVYSNPIKADLTKLDLIAYVNQLVNIESAILSMVDDFSALLMKKRRVGRMATYLDKTILRDLQSECDETDLRNKKELEALERKYDFTFYKPLPGELGLKAPNKKQAFKKNIEMPIYKKPGFFNKKKVNEENERLKRNYEAALEAANQEYMAEVEENNRRYEAEMAEYSEKLKVRTEQETAKRQAVIDKRKLQKETEKKKLLEERNKIEEKRNSLASVAVKELAENPIIQLDAMLDKEIEEAKEEIKKLCDCKVQLAALGMYPKYLDIVALTTMAEYLETGRCSTLTGADGAYNLYESEIRANRVIAQLDQVIDSLETIKANQYKTYQVLSDISIDTGRMVATMDKMAHSLESIDANTEAIKDNTDVIAYNTAKTAHYAKINTQLTNALGFMVALK